MVRRNAGMVLMAVSLLSSMFLAGCNDPYLAGGQERILKSDWDAAIKSFKDGLGDPTATSHYGIYYQRLMECYFNTNAYQDIRPAYDSAVKYMPDSTELLNKQMESYWATMFNKANETLKKLTATPAESKELKEQLEKQIGVAISLNPQKAENYILKGNYYRVTGSAAEAMKMYHHAKTLDPGSSFVLYLIGRNEMEAGNWDAAIENLRKATELKKAEDLKKDNSIWFRDLGESYVHKKMVAEAIKAYNEATRLDPSDKTNWYNLGIMYYNDGKDIKSSVNAFKKVTELDDKDADAWFYLGQACLHTTVNDFDQAIMALNKALELKPDSPEYKQLLEYAVKQKEAQSQPKPEEKKGKGKRNR